MAAPTPPPPPIPLAGLTPPGAPEPLNDSPDQPLKLTSDQLSKIGVTDMQPGDVVLVTAKIVIGGQPDAPDATITAIGDVHPDDGSENLVNLSDEAVPPTGTDGGVPLTIGDDLSSEQNETDEEGTPPFTSGRSKAKTGVPGTAAPGSKAEEKILGFKRPKNSVKRISAKEALGE